jgi:uncharacterized membrane protein YdbT with pleckstrin-like domain
MITADDLQSATDVERQDMARAAVEAAPEAEQKDVAKAAVDALTPEQRQDAIEDTVKAAPEAEQKGIAKAAVDALTPAQRQELIKSNWPQESTDRLYVYVAGFSAAVVVVLGLALVAWGAGANTDLSTALIVLATGFSSAILGGLLGAYVQK